MGAVVGAILGLAPDVAAYRWLMSAVRRAHGAQPGDQTASQGAGSLLILLLLVAPVLVLVGGAIVGAIGRDICEIIRRMRDRDHCQ